MKNFIVSKNTDLRLFSEFAKGATNIITHTNNCVIYTRVSSKEQADTNMSLQTQLKQCTDFCYRSNLKIIQEFGGTYESAKNDDRKEFNKMLNFVRNKNNQISHIIVYSLDRFSRSGANAMKIMDDLNKKGIKVSSVTQPADSSTSSGQFQQKIQMVFSEYDNLQRKEKCVTGTKEALLRGEWCNKPPIGYNTVKVNGKRQIVVNEVGQLLKKAFIWKANYNWSIQTIVEKLRLQGLKIYQQQLSNVFRNPFYCGLLSHAALKGDIVEGKQEILISKELFLKVNNDLSINPHGYKLLIENEKIPLKNYMKCNDCGSSMAGYIVKKKNLWYYKCRKKGCCNNVSAKIIHDNFLGMLKPFQLELSPQANQFISKQILRSFTYKIKEKELEESHLKNQLKDIEDKISKLEEKFILDLINNELYHKFHDKYKDEKLEVLTKLDKYQNKVSNLEMNVNKVIEFSSNISSLWVSSNYDNKLKIQKLLFPKGISYDREK
jgi:site-specific DNA recombinase